MSVTTSLRPDGPLITTRGLNKTYGAVTALADLDLDLAPGVIGLVGANGAGKTTLLKILLGLLEPTSGNATMLGFDAVGEGPAIRRLVGYMPEHDPLPPDVSATVFVLHMARMSGLPAAAARERTADTLRHVGLYEERYRSIGGYSTGMRQRVRLAQALVHDPSLVLLDEPTNGLDPAGREEMLELIRRIGTDFGISVLVTSHLLGELERISDHLVVIEGGRLLRSTSTASATTLGEVVGVEVGEDAAALAAVLSQAGLVVRPGGRLGTLDIDVPSLGSDSDSDSGIDSVCDAVRDATADLGIGLIRLERRRHRLAEIFADPAPAANTTATEVPA